MLILPAIDIRDGKVVRLIKGDFKKETVYFNRPEEIACRWEKEGAEMLHVVDLDGALSNSMKNLDSIAKIIRKVNIPIEVGGGIRNYKDIEKIINLGVKRVILSTVAHRNKQLLKKAISKFNDKIAVSIDSKNDEVMVEGWIKSSHINLFDFAKELENSGLKTIIYTDIESDGTLGGVNITKIKSFLLNTNLSVIVSGGVSKLEDLKELKKLEKFGLEGVIIGKALYDKKFSLKEALKVSEERI